MTGIYADHVFRFNTQPPEGGCRYAATGRRCHLVSTHSRPKAAARLMSNRILNCCFNTQPPEGGWVVIDGRMSIYEVSTHSRPKAAAVQNQYALVELIVSTHSRPKAAGKAQSAARTLRRFQHTAARRRLGADGRAVTVGSMFQHTAARRRLPREIHSKWPRNRVSTHSRPKAAVGIKPSSSHVQSVSTHSRPKAAEVIYFFLSIK